MVVAVGVGAALRTAVQTLGLSERRAWCDHLSTRLSVLMESARPRGSKPTAETHPHLGRAKSIPVDAKLLS